MTEPWAAADLVTPMALRVAATLRLADRIEAGGRTAEDLAAQTGADADTVDRLARHLVTIGVLDQVDGHYSLTPDGNWLRDDHPAGMRSRLDIAGGTGRAELAFTHLWHSIQTGEASFPLLYGRSFWEDLAADPERTAAYDREMGRDVSAWAEDLAAAYDWASLGHVVDVGGGEGTLLAALLDACPGLRGTVFEQPLTAAAARATLAGSGFGDRSSVIEGSFFDAVPPAAGGYLLCAVLHDWGDGPAVEILSRCAEAAGPDGRVLVVEKTGSGAVPPTAMDLRMLVYFGGRERTGSEISALAGGAGLRTLGIHSAGELSIVELGSGRPH